MSSLALAPHQSYETTPGLFALDCVRGPAPTLDRGKMRASGIYAAASTDRVGDVLHIDGIYLDNHKENAVALWNHGRNYPLPIGSHRDEDGNYMVQIDPEAGIATASTRFSQRSLVAEQIFALIDEKIIGAQSIGFRELKVEPLVYMNGTKAKDLIAVEQTEISWCCTPVNAECVGGHAEMVRKALSIGQLCGKSLSPVLVQSLTPFAEKSSIWANGWTPDGKALSAVDATGGGVLVGSRARGKDFDETQHPRDRGKFATGSGSGAPPTAASQAAAEDAPTSTPAADAGEQKAAACAKFAALGSALLSAGIHAEHVVTQFKYLGPLAPVARGVYGAMIATYTGAQTAVRAVAAEKGLDESQVNRVAGVCCAVDLVCAKAVPLSLEQCHFGAAAFGAGFVPVGSVAYLAWSTATNPKATYQAAAKGVKAALAKVQAARGKSAEDDTRMENVILAIADRVKALGDDADFWFAALMAGLDQSGGDIDAAIAAADAATPYRSEEPDDVDVELDDESEKSLELAGV